MNAPANIRPDDICIIMGPLPEDEFELRAKLRSYRNAATAMIAATHSDTARLLAWEAIAWITPHLYAPASPELLEQLLHLVSRLLRTAITAEDFERLLREAAGA
jgi:hypothetical protein